MTRYAKHGAHDGGSDYTLPTNFAAHMSTLSGECYATFDAGNLSQPMRGVTAEIASAWSGTTTKTANVVAIDPTTGDTVGVRDAASDGTGYLSSFVPVGSDTISFTNANYTTMNSDILNIFNQAGVSLYSYLGANPQRTLGTVVFSNSYNYLYWDNVVPWLTSLGVSQPGGANTAINFTWDGNNITNATYGETVDTYYGIQLYAKTINAGWVNAHITTALSAKAASVSCGNVTLSGAIPNQIGAIYSKWTTIGNIEYMHYGAQLQ